MRNEHLYWVNKLEMLAHPEGGFYKETYRSENSFIANDNLFKQEERVYSTGIYFLLNENNFSAFHKIKSDEMWHYYTGSNSLIVHEIDLKGNYKSTAIGPNIEAGEVFQYVVKAGVWFASDIKKKEGFALVGCTVSPGFDFKDFEMADQSEMILQFPYHKKIIESLTRKEYFI